LRPGSNIGGHDGPILLLPLLRAPPPGLELENPPVNSQYGRYEWSTMLKTATISDDAIYRYDLTRQWGPGPWLAWIMLNPSTADGDKDDPTIRRCMGFSRRDGYGGLVVLNLFAFRSPKPERLLRAKEPQGPENGATLNRWLDDPLISGVVFAWGGWIEGSLARRKVSLVVRNTLSTVRASSHRPVCLGTTTKGAPRHPLYVPATQPFEAF
jgi:hypothetical protein